MKIRKNSMQGHSGQPFHVSVLRFTLIELLVVIAIIAILASILIPGLARAREQAFAASCLGNFKQLQFCLASYFSDNNEIFPTSRGTAGSDGSEIQLNNGQYYAGLVGFFFPYFVISGKGYKDSNSWKIEENFQAKYQFGGADFGKFLPPWTVCQAYVRTKGVIKGDNPYSARPVRKGVVTTKTRGVIKKSDTVDNPTTHPANNPAGIQTSRCPNPSRYAYMAEVGWEPGGNIGGFEKHASTRYSRATDLDAGISGYVQYGHATGWTVSFLDGHCAHKAHKRIHKDANSDINSNGIYQTRVVNIYD